MKNILIVDDEIDIWFLLSNILRRHGFKTHFVNNLKAAARSIDSDRPDLVFLDNHLGDGLGIEFIPVIKKHFPTVKIVLITGVEPQHQRTKAIDYGADYFIAKPFNSEAIEKALEIMH